MNRATNQATAYPGLLAKYLRPQSRGLTLLAALLLGSIGLQLLNPQIIRYFVDATQAHAALDRLLPAGLAFVAVGLAQQAIGLSAAYAGLNVGWAATNALRADLAGHLLRLDMSFHKTHTPGELIERVDGDVTMLTSFFSRMLVRMAGNGLLVAGVVALLWKEDWRAGLGLAAYVVLALAAMAALHNFGARRSAESRQAWAEQNGYLEERFSGTEDIRGSGAEAYVLHRLYGFMRQTLEKSRRTQLAQSLGFVVNNFLFIAGYGLGLALGAYLYTQGAVSIGTAFIIVYYIGMVASPLDTIREQASDLQEARAGIGRVRQLLRLRPQVTETVSATLHRGPLSVSFGDLSFGYDDRAEADVPGGSPESPDMVLHDVCFDLPPGHILGVLGRTGSGKTTLTRLLFRLYDPAAGSIRLGGVDIRDVSFADLRARVGLVTQDVQLFKASLRDNIAFFNPRIADERIERALGELGIAEWVAGMSGGLGARLGAGGGGMSAGEAQLLAFTRIFLKDPGLIILDEAASRLDPVTEHRLERAVSRLLAGRTAIIVAHRLRTVQRADSILILEAGRVIEYGPRAALAADPNSRFYSLLQTGLEEALA